MHRLRELPRRDVVVAGAVSAVALVATWHSIGDGTIYHGPRWPNAVLALLITGTLAFRQLAPLGAVVWVACVLGLSELVVRHDLQTVTGFFTLIALVASAGYHTSRRRSAVALAIGAGTLAAVCLVEPRLASPSNFAIDLAFMAVPWLLMRGLREREQRAAALGAELGRVQVEQEAREQQALADERARIARELHDVVAHSLSVMLLQVGAARLRADGDSAVAEPLLAAEASGRQALTELRRLLTLLREDADGIPTDPQPSLATLESLVAGVREGGLPVQLLVDGPPRPLPAGVELSAYRIVQEALTNVMKHARPTHVTVRVTYAADRLVIDVDNDGAAGAPATRGHGLIGMSERGAMLGGVVRSQARGDGGWTVHADLPVPSADRQPEPTA